MEYLSDIIAWTNGFTDFDKFLESKSPNFTYEDKLYLESEYLDYLRRNPQNPDEPSHDYFDGDNGDYEGALLSDASRYQW